MEKSECGSSPASALAQFLAVPGARVTLPVSAATSAFATDFVQDARARFGNFHFQMGGDHALYYAGHLSEFMPTAMSVPDARHVPLEEDLRPGLGALRQTTERGELTLDEFVEHPMFRLQGIMLLHRGKIVYQRFPGMKPMAAHIWASSAKVAVGLVAAMLAEEGQVDVRQSVTRTVPQLAGTAWDAVRVIDALNHTPALDIEETIDALVSPGSIIVRFFSAAFGAPNPVNGKVERWLDVLRDVRPLADERPGERFRYSSLNTMVLAQMVENLEGRPWSQVFEQRVWSRMGARQPAQTTLTPEGSAIAFGLVSTTLEDFARFGLLFTPSWDRAAHERVVTPAVLTRVRSDDNTTSYQGSAKSKAAMSLFNEQARTQSYQFDYVFADGAMYKGGNLGQSLYVDPERDFVGVAFSTCPLLPPFGEFKAPAFMRAAARSIAGM